jgi:very-short-patch-repair endonuclease
VRLSAASHHGVITRAEASQAGLSESQIRRRVASGAWSQRSNSVFVLAGAPRTRRQDLLVAALVVDGAAAQRSAAWLLGLDDRGPGRPVVGTARRGGTRHRWFTLCRMPGLAPGDLTVVDGIATTNATRTVLDLAACCDDTELARLVDRARRRGLTHLDRLAARFATHARPGRPGVARARRVLSELDADLALVDSDLESMTLSLLVSRGLPRPVCQHPVTIAGRRYRIDLAYPDQRVAIELDGFEFHSARDRFELDRTRQNDLVLAGWRVLRFTWRQVCREPDLVATRVAEALRSR